MPTLVDVASTSSSKLLKTIFQGRSPAWTALMKSKFLSEVEHDRDYGGDDNATVNVTIAAGSGVGSTFEAAKANIDETNEKRFALGFKQLYALTAIKGSAIARSRSNKHAIARLLDHNVKHTTEKFNRALSSQIWSIGGGAMTKLTATGATLTNDYFTCEPASDAGKFEVGDYLVFASDDGTDSNPAGTRGGGSRLRVTAVNLKTGKVTLDDTLDSVPAIAATDYVFREGDYSYAFTGIRGWVPATDTLADTTFKGVARGAHLTRLAGLRYNTTGGMLWDKVRNGLALAAQTGASPNRLYTNPADFVKLEREVDAKAWIDLPEVDPRLGHRGIRYESAVGSVIVVSEPWCPEGYGYALNLSTWRLRTAGDCPMFLDEDKLGKLHRLEASDAYEVRMGCYGELECQNPGENLVITW